MACDADDFVCAENGASLPDDGVLPSDMRPVRAGLRSKPRRIVDYEQSAAPATQVGQHAGPTQAVDVCSALVAVLQDARAARQGRIAGFRQGRIVGEGGRNRNQAADQICVVSGIARRFICRPRPRLMTKKRGKGLRLFFLRFHW